MVIYYYDYDISPKPVEELYLTINYNEIYTYLKFNVVSSFITILVKT